MPYFHDSATNLLFIHIPRTAGLIIESYLSNKYGKTFLYNEIVTPLHHRPYTSLLISDLDTNNLTVLTAVRNPYSRVLEDLFMHHMINKDSTRIEVENILKVYFELPYHLQPQYMYLTDSMNNIDNRIKIVKAEKILTDMSTQGFADFDSSIIERDYLSFLSPTSISLINHRYQFDFTYLNYTMIDNNIYDVIVYCGGKCGGASLTTTFLNNGYKTVHVHNKLEKGIMDSDIEISSLFNIINESSKHKKIYIIDSYRTPIERKISSFFQWLNVHLVKNINVLISIFNTMMIDTLEEYHPIDEAMAVYNVPQFTTFDFKKGYNIVEKDNIIFIKLLFNDINKWGLILSEIIGKPVRFYSNNVTQNKDIYCLYDTFKKNYKTSLSYLTKYLVNDTHFKIYNSIEDQTKYIDKWTLCSINYDNILEQIRLSEELVSAKNAFKNIEIEYRLEKTSLVEIQNILTGRIAEAHTANGALRAAHQATLEETVAAHQATVTAHQSTIAAHQATIAAHQATIAAHQATLEETVAAHQATVTAHQSTIAAHQATIAAHQATIAAHQATLEETVADHNRSKEILAETIFTNKTIQNIIKGKQVALNGLIANLAETQSILKQTQAENVELQINYVKVYTALEESLAAHKDTQFSLKATQNVLQCLKHTIKKLPLNDAGKLELA